MNVFKVWDHDRQVKKCFMCEVDLEKLIKKGITL